MHHHDKVIGSMSPTRRARSLILARLRSERRLFREASGYILLDADEGLRTRPKV